MGHILPAQLGSSYLFSRKNMTSLNPLFAICIFLAAFITAYAIQTNIKWEPRSQRYESIDGMRGFLAISVFIHHASIWERFIRTGRWELGDSNFFNQLGNTSVSLFFMITSFLFITKLIESREKGFNWRDFFISRIFRLMPMYYFSLLLLIVSVMSIAKWKLNIEISELIKSISAWIFFTITGTPNINGLSPTWIINAGVAWSLPYEWLFYFSLPLLSLSIVKSKPQTIYIFTSIAFGVFFYITHGVLTQHIYSFIGGAIAPCVIAYTSLSKKIDEGIGCMIIFGCFLAIGQFHSAENIVCILLISIAFTTIALGNSLFGLLNNNTLKFLGEISYSTYLLHGIILSNVFIFGCRLENMKQFNSAGYCSIVIAIAPVVVILSFLGFKYIEQPFMNRSKAIIQKLNAVNEI
jgi:peptidoglycan/LPS O-acetylase OafA/YrhL